MKLEELNPSLFENKQIQRISLREAPGFFRPAPEPDAASEEKIVSPTGP